MEQYRGYLLTQEPEGVAIMHAGEVIDVAESAHEARKIVDTWLAAW